MKYKDLISIARNYGWSFTSCGDEIIFSKDYGTITVGLEGDISFFSNYYARDMTEDREFIKACYDFAATPSDEKDIDELFSIKITVLDGVYKEFYLNFIPGKGYCWSQGDRGLFTEDQLKGLSLEQISQIEKTRG